MPFVPFVFAPLEEQHVDASTDFVSFVGGTSMAGLLVKKSEGVIFTLSISTGLASVRIEQTEMGHKYSHHGPVFHSRIVRQAENTPKHNILVKYIVVSSSCIRNSTDFRR